MPKRDIKSELKNLYRASSKRIDEIDVPELKYLMIDGKGDPNTTAEYAQAVEALFSASYTAKFMLKRANPTLDYTVMPLEGLWWADDWLAFATNERANWQWTMMIMQPDFVPEMLIKEAIKLVAKKKSLPALKRMRLEPFAEGHCAQVLHVGPFTDEGPTIAKLHDYIDARTARRGKHHEIYLSDIRRATPSNWKTIIRQPMKAVAI